MLALGLRPVPGRRVPARPRFVLDKENERQQHFVGRAEQRLAQAKDFFWLGAKLQAGCRPGPGMEFDGAQAEATRSRGRPAAAEVPPGADTLVRHRIECNLKV